MALFRTDLVTLCYASMEAAKKWWIDAFDCKQVIVPPEWDSPLPSDVALKLPGDSEPTILLSSQAEVQQAGFDRSSTVVPIIFSDRLKKAYELLSSRGVLAGPIQEDSQTQFFEIRDLEGHPIQICKEP
jgi:hypothetical protein